MEKICSDLDAQYQELNERVARLDEIKWHLETPFYQWTIFDEVAHIAFFDQEALLAIDEPVRFKAHVREIMKIVQSADHWPERFNVMLGAKTPEDLLSNWCRTRTCLLDRLRIMAPEDRLIWYGPDMSARSFATARLMETWAHTQDIFDALGEKRKSTARLRHVAHMGVTTFGWSFKIRGLTVPLVAPRVELYGPDGEIWTWGEPEASDRVWGNAEEFCLVVTQRRNVADTRLKWQGSKAGKWLSIAQAFAGIPQEAPAPGARRVDYL